MESSSCISVPRGKYKGVRHWSSKGQATTHFLCARHNRPRASGCLDSKPTMSDEEETFQIDDGLPGGNDDQFDAFLESLRPVPEAIRVPLTAPTPSVTTVKKGITKAAKRARDDEEGMARTIRARAEEIQHQETRIAELRAQTEQLSADVETLTGQKEELESQAETARATIAQLEAANVTLSAEKTSLEGDKQALQGELAGLGSNKTELLAQISQLQRTKSSAEAALTNVYSQVLAGLSNNILLDGDSIKFLLEMNVKWDRVQAGDQANLLGDPYVTALNTELQAEADKANRLVEAFSTNASLNELALQYSGKVVELLKTLNAQVTAIWTEIMELVQVLEGYGNLSSEAWTRTLDVTYFVLPRHTVPMLRNALRVFMVSNPDKAATIGSYFSDNGGGGAGGGGGNAGGAGAGAGERGGGNAGRAGAGGGGGNEGGGEEGAGGGRYGPGRGRSGPGGDRQLPSTGVTALGNGVGGGGQGTVSSTVNRSSSGVSSTYPLPESESEVGSGSGSESESDAMPDVGEGLEEELGLASSKGALAAKSNAPTQQLRGSRRKRGDKKRVRERGAATAAANQVPRTETTSSAAEVRSRSVSPGRFREE